MAVRAIAAVAALIAAFSPAQPTGLRLADAFWCAAFAGLVTLAASRSRRWPLIWFAGLVTVGAIGSWWALAGLAGLVIAIVGIATQRRNRLLGGIAGGLSTLAMLRMPDIGFNGLSAILVVVAIAPLLWSAYHLSTSREQKRIERTLIVGVGLAAAASIAFAVTALIAEPQLRTGANAARDGLASIRAGEPEAAAGQLHQASTDFGGAHEELSRPWNWPARLLPIVGQHANALTTAAAAGEEVTSTAAQAAADAPYRDLQASDGSVDIAAIEAMQAPVAAAADALRTAETEVAEAQSSWLAPPVADALDELAGEIDRALPEAELADEALTLAPGLLGADGERRYLVLFTTPSETRFLGGFAGTYGVLTANNGQLGFEPSTSTGALGAGLGERTLEQFPEFQTRHGRANLDRYFQNVTVAPDLPSNAEVTQALYEQTTDERIDGVLVIDPYAVAAFLELTGPIQVEGLDQPLTAENAAQYLLHDQYLDYADDNVERRDVLEEASIAMFDALLSMSLPGPAQLGDVLGPVAQQNRLLFHSFDPAERALFERLGMAGVFATDPMGDYVSLRTANSGANKIDWFLHRSLAYDAAYDPSTGLVEATATIELRNDSPPGGLPRYIIGNIRDEPIGTNTMYLSLYSPLDFESITIDGRPVGIEVQSELGANTYSRLVTVPPQSTVTVEMKLRGVIHTGADYRLSVLNQPMANDDQLSVVVSPANDDWSITSAIGLTVDGGVASVSQPISADERYVARFEP